MDKIDVGIFAAGIQNELGKKNILSRILDGGPDFPDENDPQEFLDSAIVEVHPSKDQYLITYSVDKNDIPNLYYINNGDGEEHPIRTFIEGAKFIINDLGLTPKGNYKARIIKRAEEKLLLNQPHFSPGNPALDNDELFEKAMKEHNKKVLRQRQRERKGLSPEIIKQLEDKYKANKND